MQREMTRRAHMVGSAVGLLASGLTWTFTQCWCLLRVCLAALSLTAHNTDPRTLHTPEAGG